MPHYNARRQFVCHNQFFVLQKKKKNVVWMRDVSLRNISHWYVYMFAQIKKNFPESKVKRSEVYFKIFFTSGGRVGDFEVIVSNLKIGIFKSRARVSVSLASTSFFRSAHNIYSFGYILESLYSLSYYHN